MSVHFSPETYSSALASYDSINKYAYNMKSGKLISNSSPRPNHLFRKVIVVHVRNESQKILNSLQFLESGTCLSRSSLSQALEITLLNSRFISQEISFLLKLTKDLTRSTETLNIIKDTELVINETSEIAEQLLLRSIAYAENKHEVQLILGNKLDPNSTLKLLPQEILTVILLMKAQFRKDEVNAGLLPSLESKQLRN